MLVSFKIYTYKYILFIEFTCFLDSVHPSQIPGQIGVHAGDDVGIYASGPYSHLFAGAIEQNSIPHFAAFAAGLERTP